MRLPKVHPRLAGLWPFRKKTDTSKKATKIVQPKYAQEFYYKRRFDPNLIVLPVIGIFDLCMSYNQAWRHRWIFLLNALVGIVWLVAWALILVKRVRPKWMNYT